MFEDTHAFWTQFDKIQKNIPVVGQLKNAVQIFELKKILKIIRCVYAHLLGHLQAFGFRVNIANTDKVDIQGFKIICLQKLKEEFTCFATADNSDIQRQTGRDCICDFVRGRHHCSPKGVKIILND